MPKEEAQKVVDMAKTLGLAFVEDDYFVTDDGEEIYNPIVDRPNAEMWLLDTLMKIGGIITEETNSV